jgi:hypothetical protein
MPEAGGDPGRPKCGRTPSVVDAPVGTTSDPGGRTPVGSCFVISVGTTEGGIPSDGRMLGTTGERGGDSCSGRLWGRLSSGGVDGSGTPPDGTPEGTTGRSEGVGTDNPVVGPVNPRLLGSVGRSGPLFPVSRGLSGFAVVGGMEMVVESPTMMWPSLVVLSLV